MKHSRLIAIAALIVGLLSLGILIPRVLAQRAEGLHKTEEYTKTSMVFLPEGRFMMGSKELEGSTREIYLDGFHIGKFEVTVGDYVAYLNATLTNTAYHHPQIRYRYRAFRPRSKQRRMPIHSITYRDAQQYCSWMSEVIGRDVRLPTEAEWEYAARGGIERARFPWGWGNPRQRACFDSAGPRKVGSFASNDYGLFDVAGNVFEWCDAEGETMNDVVARGGAWSERDEGTLYVYARFFFPGDYADADVGFRVVME